MAAASQTPIGKDEPKVDVKSEVTRCEPQERSEAEPKGEMKERFSVADMIASINANKPEERLKVPTETLTALNALFIKGVRAGQDWKVFLESGMALLKTLADDSCLEENFSTVHKLRTTWLTTAGATLPTEAQKKDGLGNIPPQAELISEVSFKLAQLQGQLSAVLRDEYDDDDIETIGKLAAEAYTKYKHCKDMEATIGFIHTQALATNDPKWIVTFNVIATKVAMIFYENGFHKKAKQFLKKKQAYETEFI